MRILQTLALAALLLAACSTTPQTAPQTVYQIGVAYDTASNAVVAYGHLPRCSDTSGPVCSSQEAIDQIKKADNVFVTAWTEAKSVAADPRATDTAKNAALNSASAALKTLQAIMQQYDIKITE